MPTLPSTDQIVDLEKSKAFNKDKVFTGGAASDLYRIDPSLRASVLLHSLSKEQIMEFDKFIDAARFWDHLKVDISNRSDAKNAVLLKIGRHCIYDDEKGILCIDGKNIHVSKRRLLIRGLLTTLSESDKVLSYPYSYDEYLEENQITLYSFDITNKRQLASAKNQLNTLVPGFMPYYGKLSINNLYI